MSLDELMERGYEDAYREFIEPVVAALRRRRSRRGCSRDRAVTARPMSRHVSSPQSWDNRPTHSSRRAAGAQRLDGADDADLRDRHLRLRLGAATSSAIRTAACRRISTRATRTRRWSRPKRKLAAADGAEASLLFSSGHGRDVHRAHDAAARPATRSCARRRSTAARFTSSSTCCSGFGIARRFVSLEELATPAAVIGPKTKLVWFESPINPTLRCVDIRAVAAACRAAGVLSGIDNTFASPVNQQPLAHGRRPVDAERDEVSERPQRRHRRRALRIARAARADRARRGGCSAA